MAAADTRSTVLYDGDCAFCSWTVRQIDRLDRGARLRLVPLQDAAADRGGATLRAVAEAYPLAQAVHVVAPDGAVHAGGDAMIEIFRRLPGGALVALWSRLPGGRLLAGAAYAAVARNRATLGRVVRATGASCEVVRRT